MNQKLERIHQEENPTGSKAQIDWNSHFKYFESLCGLTFEVPENFSKEESFYFFLSLRTIPTRLTTLKLEKITPKVCELFSFNPNPTLRELRLVNCIFSHTNTERLIKGFNANTVLSEIDFRGSRIPEENAVELLSSLNKKILTHLVLPWFDLKKANTISITCSIFQSVVELINYQSNLKAFGVHQSQLSDEAKKSILLALNFKSHLETLIVISSTALSTLEKSTDSIEINIRYQKLTAEYLDDLRFNNSHWGIDHHTLIQDYGGNGRSK